MITASMWKLFYDFYSLTGPVFDHNYVKPGLEFEDRKKAEKDQAAALVIPNLRHIPRDVLKSVVAELDKEDAEMKEEMERVQNLEDQSLATKAANSSKHSGANFKLYITHHQKLSHEARSNTFAGQASRGAA